MQGRIAQGKQWTKSINLFINKEDISDEELASEDKYELEKEDANMNEEVHQDCAR